VGNNLGNSGQILIPSFSGSNPIARAIISHKSAPGFRELRRQISLPTRSFIDLRAECAVLGSQCQLGFCSADESETYLFSTETGSIVAHTGF
jgi:hypothetical protein